MHDTEPTTPEEQHKTHINFTMELDGVQITLILLMSSDRNPGIQDCPFPPGRDWPCKQKTWP